MEFLTAALYKLRSENDVDPGLSGALITTFDPEDDTSRASVLYMSVEKLRPMCEREFQPQGFTFNNDGVLVSDTGCRKVLESELESYIGAEFKESISPATGLIDLVLFGSECGAYVIVNAKECIEMGEAPIAVPFSSFRVSDSSFNIYAPYKRADGRFRTMSLIDIETEEVYPVVVSVAAENAGAIRGFGEKFVQPVEVPGVTSEERVAFKANFRLEPAVTFTGEAFCNYLAFNIAYYKMGLQILDEFMSGSGYVPYAPVEDEERGARKVPKRNLNIVSTIKRHNTRSVIQRLGDPAALEEFRRVNIEGDLTYCWLVQISLAKSRIEADDDAEKTTAACMSLKEFCKRRLLHFSCEMLAQRIYLANLGKFDSSIGPTLKGGGVRGFSVKRTSW